MKSTVRNIIKDTLSNMLVMNDVERQSETATNQIMESFKAWLLQQAHKDSQNDFRQTRAYDLYVRLDSE